MLKLEDILDGSQLNWKFNYANYSGWLFVFCFMIITTIIKPDLEFPQCLSFPEPKITSWRWSHTFAMDLRVRHKKYLFCVLACYLTLKIKIWMDLHWSPFTLIFSISLHLHALNPLGILNILYSVQLIL